MESFNEQETPILNEDHKIVPPAGNPFFDFINPMLHAIDNGKMFRKPISWLYATIAILNLLFPFGLIAKFKDELSYAEGKILLVICLLWFVIAFASWVGFQIWWNRKEKVIASSKQNDDFVTTPIIAHFIQTVGEWLCSTITIVGVLGGLIVGLFIGTSGFGFGNYMDYVGWASIFAAPLIGYGYLVFFRYIAELIRAFAAIANNTNQTVKNTTK